MPEAVINILLLFFGAAMGSFIDVLGSRYSKNNSFRAALGGRSRCPSGKHKLEWIDLIPVLSFLFLRGKCRTCKASISWRYPLVEVLSALIALFVPLQLGFGIPALFWVVCLWTLLLISLIDLRLKIIPNSLIVLLVVLGLGLMTFKYFNGFFDELIGFKGVSLMGVHYLTFRIGTNALMNHLYAAILSLSLFGGVYLLSRGKGMGMGDVKLATALGAWLVFPDMVLALVLAFVTGSVVGITMMSLGKLKFKSNVPFGPFIATGVTLVFFFGYDIVNAYFQTFGLF